MAQEAQKPELPTTFTAQSLVNDVAEGYYVLSGLNENENECFLQSVQAKIKQNFVPCLYQRQIMK